MFLLPDVPHGDAETIPSPDPSSDHDVWLPVVPLPSSPSRQARR
jgi:hypothetical protein